MKRCIFMAMAIAIIFGLALTVVVRAQYTASQSQPPETETGDCHYFIRPALWESEENAHIVKNKLLTQFCKEAIVDSRESADVIIVVSTSYSTIPGSIFVDYRDSAANLAQYIVSHTVEAILCQKEEEVFAPLTKTLESRFAKNGIFLRKALWLSERDYYKFLLRLRSNPKTQNLVKQLGSLLVIDYKFSSYSGVLRIAFDENFETINNFLTELH